MRVGQSLARAHHARALLPRVALFLDPSSSTWTSRSHSKSRAESGWDVASGYSQLPTLPARVDSSSFNPGAEHTGQGREVWRPGREEQSS